jgi:hypothetical protein
MNEMENVYYSFDNNSSRRIVHDMDFKEIKSRFLHLYGKRFDGDIVKNIQYILKHPQTIEDNLKLMRLNMNQFISFAISFSPRIFNKRMIMYLKRVYNLKIGE